MNLKILITGTLLIIIFSWIYSINAKRYHGISRIFSFESIFILTLLNYRTWLNDLFGNHLMASWILMISSAYTGIAGYLTLRFQGEAKEEFENTTVLVRSGIYKYVRHPLYSSLLFIGTAIMLVGPGLIQIMPGVINGVAIYITSRIEENAMKAKFGTQYIDYMLNTKMFIPFLI